MTFYFRCCCSVFLHVVVFDWKLAGFYFLVRLFVVVYLVPDIDVCCPWRTWMQPLLYFLIEMYVLGWWSDLCLAVSTSSVVTVAASSATTSGQTFHIAAAAGSMAGSVITAKLPVPANSKIVTVNVPTTQGGTAGLQHHWHVIFVLS